MTMCLTGLGLPLSFKLPITALFIVIGIPIDHVVAGPTHQDVVAVAAHERVALFAADQGVEAFPARQEVAVITVGGGAAEITEIRYPGYVNRIPF